MPSDERQFLLTAAWLFLRHGQTPRALAICEALREDDPRDGTTAAALAEILLRDGNPASRPALATRCFSTNSAIGLRQMLP